MHRHNASHRRHRWPPAWASSVMTGGKLLRLCLGLGAFFLVQAQGASNVGIDQPPCKAYWSKASCAATRGRCKWAGGKCGKSAPPLPPAPPPPARCPSYRTKKSCTRGRCSWARGKCGRSTPPASTRDVRLVFLENSGIDFGVDLPSGPTVSVRYDGRGARSEGVLAPSATAEHTMGLTLQDTALTDIRWRLGVGEGIQTVGLAASYMSGSVNFETGVVELQMSLAIDFGLPHASRDNTTLAAEHPDLITVDLRLSSAEAEGGRALGLDGSARLTMREVMVPMTGFPGASSSLTVDLSLSR